MRFTSLCSVLLAAACGGRSPATPDGSDPGPNGAVRVTVTQAGQPVSALTVYFLDADGGVVATTTTDAAGQASATLHTGGSVTVVHAPLVSSREARDLDSWVDVQPGDELALDLPVGGDWGIVKVSAPAATLPDVAAYRIVSPCGGSGYVQAGEEFVLGLSPVCAEDPHSADFAVFAVNAGEQDIAGFFAPQVGVSNGQHLALTGTYEPLADIAVVVWVPPGGQDVALTVSALSADGLTNVANTVAHGTAGKLDGRFHWPAQLTSGTRVIEAYPAIDTGNTILTWAPVGTSVSIFVDEIGQAITSQPILDATRQQLSWMLDDHGAPAQLAVASLSVDQADGTRVAWNIAAPGLRQEISLPPLPSSVVAFPSPQTSGVGLVLLRMPGGTASWTQIFGAGGYLDRFTGLMSTTPSGMIGEVMPPGVPL